MHCTVRQSSAASVRENTSMRVVLWSASSMFFAILYGALTSSSEPLGSEPGRKKSTARHRSARLPRPCPAWPGWSAASRSERCRRTRSRPGRSCPHRAGVPTSSPEGPPRARRPTWPRAPRVVTGLPVAEDGVCALREEGPRARGRGRSWPSSPFRRRRRIRRPRWGSPRPGPWRRPSDHTTAQPTTRRRRHRPRRFPELPVRTG